MVDKPHVLFLNSPHPQALERLNELFTVYNHRDAEDKSALVAAAAEVSDMGSTSIIEMCDISDRDAVQAMAKSAIGRFGRIDVLVNNAAIRPSADFLKITEAEWGNVIDTNFYSAFHLARACLPGMVANGWGRIIHFTGMNAQQGYPGKAAVSVSKHALWGLTKTLSKEFGRQGITTNIISPGTFPDKSVDVSTPGYQALLKSNPTGRLGTGDDIAAMVDLLVSEHGGFINGQMLQVNGGVVNQF